MTDNDKQEIDGQREVAVDRLQTRYAVSYQEAERDVDDFAARRP